MRIFALLSLIGLLLAGCAGLTDDAAGTNEVIVLLASGAEAPISLTAESEEPSPDALRVTFGRVALVPADDDGEGIVEIDLVGDVDLLTVELPALSSGEVQQFASDGGLPEDGVYGQLRLIVDSAAWVFGEGESEETVPIFVPSGAQSGLKIAIEPPLEIAFVGEHVLTVVFDVETAIVEAPPGSGNYILKPTAVRVLNEQLVEGIGD
jgi:hypothetical protein